MNATLSAFKALRTAESHPNFYVDQPGGGVETAGTYSIE